MFAGNMMYVHIFKFIFSLLDQDPIPSEVIVFHVIFSPDLGCNELRVSEYFNLLGS